MDSKKLWIVVDASGSTSECGRKMLNRQICRNIEQFVRFGYGSADLHLVIAAGEVSEVEWNTKDEFPLDKLPCLGTFNSAEIVKFFEGKSGRVLIVTDGYVGAKGADILSDWAQGLDDSDSVRMIVTNPAKKFRSNSIKAFTPQELFLALDRWLEAGASAKVGSEEDEW
ncbi:MAG: hypothetical protein IKJ45_06020 [Kiritimatiellae bacterium]|nr:hypothetical protein [Kiritimatiellia bacterium]